MGNKKFSFSKRLFIACAIMGILVACMAVSAFAASYGIPETVYGDVSTGTATISVSGAGSNQITIVVRKDNDNWVTDPNANVIYIDQVTGQGATTNITFGVDPKWISNETYKVFVGGSGMEVASGDFIYSGEVQPPEGHKVTGYVQTYAAGATVTLAPGVTADTDANGKFEFTDVEDGTYNAVITAKAALPRTITVVVSGADVEVSTSSKKIDLMYGDIDGSGKIDNSDLATIKGLFNKTSSDAAFNASADLDDSGKIDNSDLATVKGLFNKVVANYSAWVK